MSFVTDDQASSALEFMMRNAKEIGKARANADLAEDMAKRVKAIEMLRSDAKTVTERENEALASEAYLKAITEAAEAGGKLEEMRALSKAAELRIECWRSLAATQRSIRAA